MNSATCSIFFHNYYGNDEKWFSFFEDNFASGYSLYYNCVASSYYRLKENRNPADSFNGLDNSRLLLRQSSNIGKDIGGKLVLMDAYLRMDTQSDYILLMHDKKSPYHSNTEEWSKQLLSIANRDNIAQAISCFESNTETGIVAAKNTIHKGEDIGEQSYLSSAIYNESKNRYQLKPTNSAYVAGAMFWVRASVFRSFFSTHEPLSIRANLEKGNVMDDKGPTKTHAWERFLSWIVTSAGYQIKGI